MNQARTTDQNGPAGAAAPTQAPPPAATEALSPPPPLTAEEIEDLKTRAAKAEEHWDRLLRTAADFENFKKRAARERQDSIRFANEGLMTKLIPVLENLDTALAAAKSCDTGAAKSFHDGIEMIAQLFRNALAEAGLEEVDATGKMFDPTLHEAISQIESTNTPEGQVAQQVRRGYRLHGRLLRPASVIVATAPTQKKGNPA